MSSFDLNVIFPGRSPASITDDEFLRALKALGLPAYQARSYYTQFGKLANRPNNFTLFTAVFAPATPSTPTSTGAAAALSAAARGGVYPYRRP